MSEKSIYADMVPGTEVPQGIYFGMPEPIYFGDPTALGSTSIKELVLDCIEFQYDRLHGEEPKETFALKWGSAIHCRALEGAESLAENFPVEPDKADYPGLLDTMDDFRAFCSELGFSAGKSKADAIAKVREFDKVVPIWEEIKSLFEAGAAGKTTIPKKAIAHIEQAVAWMQKDQYLAPVMENGTMTAGASEVSIFYEDSGVRLKARIDHLLSHAVVDLKSFRPVFSERVRRAAIKAIERMRYDVQAASYIRALRHAKTLWEQGRVFNNRFQPEFLESVFKSLDQNELKWIWVLIKATGAPQPVVREFNLGSMVFRNAERDVETAIENYRNYVAEFGLDKDWAPQIPAEILSDEDFSVYSFM